MVKWFIKMWYNLNSVVDDYVIKWENVPNILYCKREAVFSTVNFYMST